MTPQACCAPAPTLLDSVALPRPGPGATNVLRRVVAAVAAALLAIDQRFFSRLSTPRARVPEHLLDDVDACGTLRAAAERDRLMRQVDAARLDRGWIDSPW